MWREDFFDFSKEFSIFVSLLIDGKKLREFSDKISYGKSRLQDKFCLSTSLATERLARRIINNKRHSIHFSVAKFVSRVRSNYRADVGQILSD